MPRIFVAIPLPAEIAAQLHRAVPALPGLKRVQPSLMHATLAFVGQVGEEHIRDITTAVRAAAGAHPPFDIDLRGIGRFPDHGRPRVVWSGMGARASDAVVRLGASVRAELLRHLVRFDAKSLRAHVTIGRVRDDVSEIDARAIAAAVREARIDDGLSFRAASLHVMESKLSPEGPLYSSRDEVALGIAPGGSPTS